MAHFQPSIALDLLRPKRMKDIALRNVAVILLVLLGIPTAGCSQAELTEPAVYSRSTAAPSEAAQPSTAIAISEPTAAPPETAQPRPAPTRWRIADPENLVAATPHVNLHIHDVVISPKHITVVYSIDLLNEDSNGSEASLSPDATLAGPGGGVHQVTTAQRLAAYGSTTLASITFEPYKGGSGEMYLHSPALVISDPDSSQTSQITGPTQLQILTRVAPDDSSNSITRFYGLRRSISGAITAGIPGSFVGSSPRGQVATVGYQIHDVEKWYLVTHDGRVEDLSREDSADILGFLGITAPTPAGGRSSGAEQTGGGRTPPVAFPRHNAPLGTDRGEQYTAGKLVLEEGCLRVEVPARGSSLRVSRLVIWPSSFTFEEESGSIRIIDGLGRTVARVGDHIRVSRAAVTYQQARDQEFTAEGVGHCARPSTWVGDEVTVFDPENEATELRLSDPDVLLLRQKTVMAAERTFMTAAGVGELVLDGQCLRLKAEYSTSTIIWPAGFRPHIRDGVVQVRNGAGRVIAQVGDEIAGGGGYYERGLGECPGEAFRVYDVKVLPDVEVYFPRQDEFLDTRPKPVRFTGELVLNGICLEVENAVRVGSGSHFLGPMLLIWPSAFELSLEGGRQDSRLHGAGRRTSGRQGPVQRL